MDDGQTDIALRIIDGGAQVVYGAWVLDLAQRPGRRGADLRVLVALQRRAQRRDGPGILDLAQAPGRGAANLGIAVPTERLHQRPNRRGVLETAQCLRHGASDLHIRVDEGRDEGCHPIDIPGPIGGFLCRGPPGLSERFPGARPLRGCRSVGLSRVSGQLGRPACPGGRRRISRGNRGANRRPVALPSLIRYRWLFQVILGRRCHGLRRTRRIVPSRRLPPHGCQGQRRERYRQDDQQCGDGRQSVALDSRLQDGQDPALEFGALRHGLGRRQRPGTTRASHDVDEMLDILRWPGPGPQHQVVTGTLALHP